MIIASLHEVSHGIASPGVSTFLGLASMVTRPHALSFPGSHWLGDLMIKRMGVPGTNRQVSQGAGGGQFASKGEKVMLTK